ncbi:hypothetical protein [Enterocloster lavalensis]|uniref:hypothetical protein n=1 Tax=Enterocloster lavalensis TaxID=460384 RepID=UPI002A826C45|nr:hypothetical protein [Enterocloster lavalensis]
MLDKVLKPSPIPLKVEQALEMLNGKNISTIKTVEELGNTVGYTNEQFFNFAKQADLSGDLLQQYKDYIGPATSLTAKFGATLKSAVANIGIMLAVNTLIWAVSKAWDHFANRVENVKENAAASAQNYRDLTSEIESTNAKLEATGRRIDELNAKKNLSLVEQNELSKLQDTNEELQRHLDIKNAIKNSEFNKARNDAKKYFDTFETYSSSDYKIDPRLIAYKFGKTISQPYLDYGNQIDKANEYTTLLDNLQKDIQIREKLIADLVTDDPEHYQKDSKYKNAVKELEDLEENATQTQAVLEDLYKNFDEFDDYLLPDEDADLINSINTFYDNYFKALHKQEVNYEKAIQGVLKKEQFVTLSDELITLGKDGSLSIDILNSNFPELVGWLNKAGISAEQLYQYIMALSDPNAVNRAALSEQLKEGFIKNKTIGDSGSSKAFFEWYNEKSDEEIQILYGIKKDNDTSTWNFQDFDAQIAKRLQTELTVEANFDTKFTGPEYRETRDELIELAQSGELSEETLSSGVRFKNILQYLGVSAKDAAESINEYAKSTTTVSSAIDRLSDISSLISSANKDIEENGTIQTDTLQKIISKYPELDLVVSQYLAGLSNEKELISSLTSVYNQDVSDYKSAMVYKLSDDETFWQNIVANNKTLFETLSEGYGQDISNYQSLAIAKAKIDAELIKSLQGAWSKYYNIIYDPINGLAELSGGPDLSKASSHGTTATPEQQAAWSAATKQINQYNALIRQLNEAANVEISVDLPSFADLGGNKAAGSSASNFSNTTELDFAAESIKNLKYQLDSLNTDLDNTDPYSEKVPILQELIKKQEEYSAALQSQADLYYDEYQLSLSDLPKDLGDKITGFDSFSIETIPETLKDAVSKAQSYRDKWNSTTISIKQAEKELENLRLKQMDLAQARLDDKIGVVQNKAADIQNQMDEAEAMGLNATSKQYKSLIRLSRQEEKYNQNKLTGLQAELLLLDEDEDAYYDCLGAIQDCENAISKCAQNQAAYNKAILELPIQYLEKANDSLNDELDELQDKQDDLDSAIAGVTGHLQDQIEAQQTLRDEAEETAKKQIDAIQNEIDGLQKANDERKQQLDLEEKLYNLERAKNQKTTRIFRESEGGFVYEADSEAVRNAQSEYEDALFEQTISDMEDKIRDIEESRDALLESYDLEIDRLQKIVESWDGITEAIQRAKDMTMAGTILGSGWQDRVTSGDTGDFENVSGQYEKNDREQTWTERQIEENERLIRQVEDYIEAWQMGQITIREAREEINDIVSDVMPEIEANDERVSSLSTYTSAWSNAQVNVADSVAATTAAAANNVDELLATDARRQAVFDYAAEWSNSALAVGGALGSINEANAAAVLTEGTYLGQRLLNLGAFQETYRSMASSISTMCNSIVDSCREAEKAMRELSNAEDRYGYGQGTTHARPGLHRVAEGNRPEIIIRNSGAAFLAKRETHYPFAGGETVLNPSDTRHVLRGDHLEQIDDGLPVLKDQQTRSLIDTLGQNIPLSISGMPEAFSPSAGLTAGNVRQENVVVNFGDVNLPQVKDVDTFTRAIADGTLKSALQQRLMRNK